jgi:hypothetical protein
MKGTMMRNHARFTVCCGLLFCGILLAAARRPSRLDGPAPPTRWEVGVYRVHAGEYPFEWQDAGQRIFARTQSILLEKLGLSRIHWELERMHKESAPPFPREVVDTAFLNELGQHGWQLFDMRGEGARRSYWLRRERPGGEL